MGGVVLAGPERHRRFSDEQKIAILGESFLSGVRVREVMDRYGLASSVIYTWRKQARAGHFGGGMFTPVAVVDTAGSVVVLPDFTPEPLAQAAAHPLTDCQSRDCGLHGDGTAMIVALPDGVRVMVNGGVDQAALGRVLRALFQSPVHGNAR
jgi:transposase